MGFVVEYHSGVFFFGRLILCLRQLSNTIQNIGKEHAPIQTYECIADLVVRFVRYSAGLTALHICTNSLLPCSGQMQNVPYMVNDSV